MSAAPSQSSPPPAPVSVATPGLAPVAGGGPSEPAATAAATPGLVPVASAADVGFLREAIAEARLASARGEVPVGAVVVVEGRIVGRGHNLRETGQDPTAHAEMIAIREAARALGSWRLVGASCYVTLEPCPMCAGALVNARVERVVYGPADPKAGATRTLYEIGSDPRLNHRFALVSGVLEEECAALLRDFFADVRKKQKAARTAAASADTEARGGAGAAPARGSEPEEGPR